MAANRAVRHTDQENARGMIVPVVLTAIATVATIGIFTVWATSRNDTEALARQSQLVTHVLDDQKSLISREQEDVATWETAFYAVQRPLDMDFIAENFGSGLYEFFGHDRTYLIAPNGTPLYAMRNGGTVDAQSYSEVSAVLDPLVSELYVYDSRGALSAFTSGSSDVVPNVTDIVTIEGQPALVSLMPVATQESAIKVVPGQEVVHITAEFLDAQLAAEMSDMLLLEGARFSTEASTTEAETSLAMRDRSGKTIAYFVWKPSRPGAQVMSELLPVIGGCAILAAAIIGMLLWRLRRSTAALVASRAAAHHMAQHDVLTGLGNRAHFEIKLEQAIGDLKTRKTNQVGLLLLDLDRFKQVNDTLGHEAGDELIIQVAQRLRPLVRATDTIVRLGGDEFVVIVEQLSAMDDIGRLCDRIVKSIRQPFELRAGQAFVGVSIGVAITDNPESEGNELVRKADIALYRAKDGGRNQYQVFQEHMSEFVRAKQELEADLRAALRTDDQLGVTFTPLVRENGLETIGVAAEIRWVHPEKGEMDPKVFMPLAETCGLADIIAEFVMFHACQAGAKMKGQKVSVRIYPVQLRNPHFFDKVFAIIDETGMQPSDLEIEISEKMLSKTEETPTANLRKLRHAGVSVAVNDFGTGFTSLRLLQHFHVDRIKLDRAFLTELANSPDPEAITHAVIWLARAIGVEVSADGVDTPEQKKFLARMGCMSFQGQLFTPDGQAEWLRHAANLEQNLGQSTPKGEDMVEEIELWDDEPQTATSA